MDALRFNAIHKSFFGVKVLSDVSFTVPAGQTLGLIGENGAGKSTLMNILGGNLPPDAGAMQLGGQPYLPRGPAEAVAAGIAFVHQEFNLFANLSITENLFLTRFPRRLGLIDRSTMLACTRRLLGEVGLDLPPETIVERLSPGQRQLVEIAKALSIEPRLIILDEPTTSLTERETDHLFRLLGDLKARGIAMIYISHALSDVLRLCDPIVVLRDGAVVGSGPKDQFNIDRLIALMVGRQIEQLFPQRTGQSTAEPVLEVCGVSRPGKVDHINFVLHGGELLGISGLMGSGRTELARILFGLDPMTEGTILLDGQSIESLTPRQRIARGMAFLTEDRRSEGLFMEATIADNIALIAAQRHAHGPWRWLNRGGLRAQVNRIRQAVCITPAARNEQPVKTLSGGNQQKTVLAKWLLNEPKVFILDEPTRGIDVGARQEVYGLINRLADGGAGVLMISSEIEELIGLCDRILVMNQGRITDLIQCDQFDRERILRAALRQGHVT